MRKLLVLGLFASACAPMKFDYSASRGIASSEVDSGAGGMDTGNDERDESDKGQTPNSPGYVSKTENSALNRLGDRTYVASVLESVFGSSPTLTSVINNQMSSFGGACDPWAKDDCFPTAASGSRLARSQVTLVPTNLASREAFRIRACTQHLVNSAFVLKAVSRSRRVEVEALPNPLPFPGDEDFLAAYALFYPGREVPPGLIEGMRRVAAEAGALNPSAASIEAWRYVLLGLCESPYWQLL